MTLTPAYNYRPALWFAGLLLALLFVERLITLQPQFALQPALPAAVTFDLLAGIPLLFYFFIVRRYRLPVTTVVGAFGGALALGYYLIPAGQQQYLGWARQSLVLLEAGVLVVAVANLRRLVRAYAEAARRSADFVENLNAAFAAVFRRSMAPLVSEVVMFRYALLGWWARPEVGAGQRAFSNHRDSGFLALVITCCALSVIETAAMHMLVSRWNATAAVVVLVLDVYTLVFLLAHLRAVMLRPATLENGQLLVRIGFAWRFAVPVQAVVHADELRDTPEPDKLTLNLAKLLFTAPNVRLTFAESVTITGLYGIRRQTKQVALYVDDRAEFLRQLRTKLSTD
ncbi:hypothetical protein [Hymenobacter koreensis]|uniref:Beta-carotene 15,15'-monooxygenase n=1 Tax=Hymenobacter koreensis TaxID=1084523 RepID=A0ABP8IXB8_9BACT